MEVSLDELTICSTKQVVVKQSVLKVRALQGGYRKESEQEVLMDNLSIASRVRVVMNLRSRI